MHDHGGETLWKGVAIVCANTNFLWSVPEQGFRWVEDIDSSESLLVPRTVDARVSTRNYFPLNEFSGLFRDFAELPQAELPQAELPQVESELLQFANKYGALTAREWYVNPSKNRQGVSFVPKTGEPEKLKHWCRRIVGMHRAIMIWDCIRAGVEARLSPFIVWQEEDYDLRVLYRSHDVKDDEVEDLLIDVPQFRQ